MRSSSPEVALATVSRPRLRCSPPRGGRGVGTTTFCPGRTSAGRRTTRSRFLLLAGCARASAPGEGGAGRGQRLARDRRGRRRFAAGQTPSRLVLRLTLEIGFLGAAKLLVALARFGGLAFEAVARLALAPRLGLRLLAAAILLLARPRVEQRPGARLALLGRQGGQHDAGLGRRAARRVSPARRGPASLRRQNGLGRRRRRAAAGPGARGAGARLARRQNAALHLLDDDRLAAPVRKALPHRALLNRALQVQRRLRRRGAHRLVAIVRFTHAYS